MGKQINKSLDKAAKLQEQRNWIVKSSFAQFYTDGLVENFDILSKETADTLLANAEEVAGQQIRSQEQLIDECFEVREGVKQGKEEYIEVCFDKGYLRYKNEQFELGNSIVKIRTKIDENPLYLFFKSEDTWNAKVFIGSNRKAFLAIKKDQGEVIIVEIMECYLFSIGEKSNVQGEICLMVSYGWITSRLCFDIIKGFNLDPVKTLLLSDWLQEEWKKAQEFKQSKAENMPDKERV